MNELWQAINFWAGMSGRAIVGMIIVGVTYWLTKRIAVARIERRNERLAIK